jgi:hypothetical protein
MNDRTRTIILCVLLVASLVLLYIATHNWGHLTIHS